MKATVRYYIIAIIFFYGISIQESHTQVPFSEFIVDSPVIVGATTIKLEHHPDFGRAIMLTLERYKGDIPDTFIIEWHWNKREQSIDEITTYVLFLPQRYDSIYHDLSYCSLWKIDEFLLPDFNIRNKQKRKKLQEESDKWGYISVVRQPCLQWIQLPDNLVITVKNQPSRKYREKKYPVIVFDDFKNYILNTISSYKKH